MPFSSLGCEAGDLGNSLTLLFSLWQSKLPHCGLSFWERGHMSKKLWGSFKCGQWKHQEHCKAKAFRELNFAENQVNDAGWGTSLCALRRWKPLRHLDWMPSDPKSEDSANWRLDSWSTETMIESLYHRFLSNIYAVTTSTKCIFRYHVYAYLCTKIIGTDLDMG